MQIISPISMNKSSIKSTIDISDSSLLSSSLPSRNSNCDDTIFNNHKSINNETLNKTEVPPTYTVNSNLILRKEKQEVNNFGCSNSSIEKSYNDFMNEDSKMAETNSKRCLHNKIGDRKRRRPDSAFLGSPEVEESVFVDTLARPKQSTRQLVQRHLISVSNSLEKSKKGEHSVSTCGSKKYLRSNKQDVEQSCNDKECCNLNKVGVQNLSHIEIDVSSTICKKNSDSAKIGVNKIETGESLTNLENINFKNKVEKKHFADNKTDIEADDTLKTNNLEEKTNNNNFDSNSNINLLNKSSQKLYQSNASHLDNYTALGSQNRNDIFTTYTTNLVGETIAVVVNPICKLEEQSSLDDNDKNDIMRIETNNETNNFTTASPISTRPPLSMLNDDNETRDNYEDHINQISNSLCLENSLSSNPCCKVPIKDRENISNNESKLELNTTQAKLSNLTMNLSQINCKITQQECEVLRSQRDDEHCQHTVRDDNSDGSLKVLPTLSTYNITRLCAQTNDVPSDYSKSPASSKLENINIENNAVKDDLGVQNAAYRKEIDNKHEKKDIRQTINTEESRNIHVDKNYNNIDSCLENNSEEDGGNNSAPKADVEFKETQPTDRHSKHQQLEKVINDAADKVYTQNEEHYHHQQNVTPISTDYEQIINNNQQQPIQQDHEDHSLSHDLNLTHQQDPLHQQQQRYSTSQLYQFQQQNNHQQLHLQHQHQIHKQIGLQHHHHNLSQNTQRESRQQENSHLMEYLHPQHHHSSNNIQSPLHQQQHQIHEVYHDLMIDEFHDEHHTPYKLGLSPSTVKHENQDDGYETSAGDVLTPNSHTSSTHSVTPQHHLQQSSGAGFTTNVSKCDDQHHQQQTHNIHLQQSQHNCNLINDQIMQQELTPNESSRNLTPRDTYHFIDDDLNSPSNNNSLRNILTPPHSHSHSRVANQEAGTMNGFLAIQSDVHSTMLNSPSDVYGLTNSTVNHHLSQKQADVEPISMTAVTTTDHQQHFLVNGSDITSHDQDSIVNLQAKSMQKKRGRKKKIQQVMLPTLERTSLNDIHTAAGYIKAKERKKHDRFNGMSEEEIVKRILPDHLCENLDIVIIGINPGLFAAYKGHHYAGPGNHFWKCLYLSGLTQEQMNADEDFKLVKYGIGFTNMVQRATKGSADLTRKEIKDGSRILLEKLQRFRPKIAVFNGKLIFEVFSGKKDFNFGRQPECVEGTDTFIWVMPSSSARCAQLPRAADKVPFYAALKKFRDYLNGRIPHIDQSECVFTEERIKQQCEQQNYKNQQNNISESNSFSNTVGICISDRSLQSNAFDSESNPHNADRGPGPPSTLGGANTVSTSFMMSSLVGSQHKKKKRGRPKKIKEQEIIDPVTGNKIQINSQILTPGNEEYSNILNLSVAQVQNTEAPKKKRGRPKKVKLPTSTLEAEVVQSSSILGQKPKILSIHSITSNVIHGSPHHMQRMQQNNQHTSLYSTPPPQHQGNIYSPILSPMVSPSVNCSYTTNTPPSQSINEKLVLAKSERKSSKTTTEVTTTSQHSISEQNFCESPPPNSPNICSVDFNPPTASTATSLSAVSDNVNSEINSMHHQRLQSNQKPNFNSPSNGNVTPDPNTNTEHYQQWLSPQHNHNVHSPATVVSNTMFTSSPQQTSLNYHHQQVQSVQQQQHQQEVNVQWPLRHQSRYDDSPYLLSSSIYQTQSHHHDNQQQQQHQNSSDVARKSLSGLESLVDQIPTISESESLVLSSAALVNAQVAAAAAVESRLQSMQNFSHDDHQVGDDSHFSSITASSNLLTASSSPSTAPATNNQMQLSNSFTNLLSNNFSVSNLAASSASSNNNTDNTNITNQENYGISSNSQQLTNSNAYHHPDLMAAAVLAAAAANSPSNLSSSSAPSATTVAHHAQMYMDPHAHLTTHVPINSIYPTTSHHHHSAVAAHHHHHSAAVHYNSAPHVATDYATNNLYSTSQSNVSAGHTLHMPSPNYPYGYSTAPSQSNYSAYPHTHVNHHHGHPHVHHTAHHLGMFDRLKPSDITGYGSGF